MNDIKYVMLPRIDEKPKNVKQQPWYKERLKTKYLSNAKKGAKPERILDAKQWTFVKDGLDDFRDGLPPPHEDLLIKNSKGPSPTIINNSSWKFKDNVLPASSRLTEYQRCYSKQLPLAQAKRENIEELINSLSEHPLALYSHYSESLPAELFEEVLDILDPQINQHDEESNIDTSEYSDGKAEHSASPSRPTSKSMDETISAFTSRKNVRDDLDKFEEALKKQHDKHRDQSDKPTIRNTYKWLLKKEEARAKAKGPDPEQLKAAAIDNHIKKVTEQYCNWVKSLGGEHNIDPITLTSLFASGYDTKPPLSVPIHVVELTNIPNELRQNAYVPPNPNNETQSEKTIYRDDSTTKKSLPNRYGAWYLPKEHWHWMKSNEKLIDPKELKDTEKEEAKKRAEEINSKLAPLHGANAFNEFVKVKQPQRIPKLLEDIDEWKKDQQLKSTLNALNTASVSQSKNAEKEVEKKN